MTSKILTALTALTAFSALSFASARTSEQFLDDGSSQGGALSATARLHTFPAAFSASFSRRSPRSFLLAMNRPELTFEAKAPASFRVAALRWNVAHAEFMLQAASAESSLAE